MTDKFKTIDELFECKDDIEKRFPLLECVPFDSPVVMDRSERLILHGLKGVEIKAPGKWVSSVNIYSVQQADKVLNGIKIGMSLSKYKEEVKDE